MTPDCPIMEFHGLLATINENVTLDIQQKMVTLEIQLFIDLLLKKKSLYWSIDSIFFSQASTMRKSECFPILRPLIWINLMGWLFAILTN